MKAIIHIGMPKTGSTSIQTWLSSNYVALKAEGVRSNLKSEAFGLSPKIRRRAFRFAVIQVAMHELGADECTAWTGLGGIKIKRDMIRQSYKHQTNQLEKLSGKPGRFVHSDEQLYRCNEIQADALDRYLSRFFSSITYVIYIRNTVDFLVSTYSQKLHSSPFHAERTRAYSEFLKLCVNDLAPYGVDSSYGKLFDWSKALGNRLKIRLLEPDWLENGDLIEDLASLFGVAASGKPDRVNESFAAEYIEYVRFVNHEFDGNLPMEIRGKILEILKVSSAGKPKLAPSDAEAKAIHDFHREQEESIREEFFPNKPFLFSPKFRDMGVAPEPLTERRKSKIESEIREKMATVVWPP